MPLSPPLGIFPVHVHLEVAEVLARFEVANPARSVVVDHAVLGGPMFESLQVSFLLLLLDLCGRHPFGEFCDVARIFGNLASPIVEVLAVEQRPKTFWRLLGFMLANGNRATAECGNEQ